MSYVPSAPFSICPQLPFFLLNCSSAALQFQQSRPFSPIGRASQTSSTIEVHITSTSDRKAISYSLNVHVLTYIYTHTRSVQMPIQNTTPRTQTPTDAYSFCSRNSITYADPYSTAPHLSSETHRPSRPSSQSPSPYPHPDPQSVNPTTPYETSLAPSSSPLSLPVPSVSLIWMRTILLVRHLARLVLHVLPCSCSWRGSAPGS